MSGPKGYSVTIFDKSLAAIFSHQAEIAQLYEWLKSSILRDDRLGINYRCETDLTEVEVPAALAPFTLTSQGGTVTRVQRDAYQAAIAKKERALKDVAEKLRNLRTAFEHKRTDYAEYVQYEKSFEAAVRQCGLFKDETIASLERYNRRENRERFERFMTEANSAQLDLTKAPFSFGFSGQAGAHAKKIGPARADYERRVVHTRQSFCTDVAGPDLQRASGGGTDVAATEETAGYVAEINRLINDCSAQGRHAGWRKRLEELTRDESRKDEPFYYHEMCEEIEGCNRTIVLKREIGDLLAQLNKATVAASCHEGHRELCRRGANLLASDLLTAGDRDRFLDRSAEFEAENAIALTREEARRREARYIKNRVLAHLDELGYTAIGDMQVIDFEGGDDFLLAIPGQENFVHVRFDPDGSFKSQFVIPEDPGSLGIDARERKVEQMSRYCDSWKEAITQLEHEGVAANLEQEKNAHANYLFMPPRKYRDTVAGHVRPGAPVHNEQENRARAL